MSVAYPIFPGFKPGQSMTAPPLPIRAPTWNYKESLHFQNYGQVAVSGRKTVTKYWSNPLHSWEWKYGYIKDNPADNNPFYPAPVPATDFQMLEGFYTAMQGSGNQFAYEPPYYQVVKQVLANPDANNNVELVYTLGSYPTISGQTYGGSLVSANESVQLIDTATLVVYDGHNTNITSDMTLAAPNSVTPPLAYMPYVGYVLQFGSFTPAFFPLTATFSMYYLSRFSEDTLETENFLTMLIACSSLKFEQGRI